MFSKIHHCREIYNKRKRVFIVSVGFLGLLFVASFFTFLGFGAHFFNFMVVM